MAQENSPRLYVGSGASGGSLYNKSSNGAGAGKPLSLQQIVRGSNTTGYEYNREGTGFTPYGANVMYRSNSLSPSAEEVESYRAQQAAQARQREQDAQRSFLAYNNPDTPSAVSQQTQQYLNQFQTPGQNGIPPRQTYEGRDLGVRTPPKIFNSVQ